MEAGFPQSGAGKRLAPPDKIVARREDFVYVPTLKELIEACGEGFTTLERKIGNPFNYTGIPDKTVWWSARMGDRLGDYVNPGSTPEEALARLWLALNTKRYAGHEAHQGKN